MVPDGVKSLAHNSFHSHDREIPVFSWSLRPVQKVLTPILVVLDKNSVDKLRVSNF